MIKTVHGISFDAELANPSIVTIYRLGSWSWDEDNTTLKDYLIHSGSFFNCRMVQCNMCKKNVREYNLKGSAVWYRPSLASDSPKPHEFFLFCSKECKTMFRLQHE